jgi:DNA anti-recombination protein RmuC
MVVDSLKDLILEYQNIIIKNGFPLTKHIEKIMKKEISQKVFSRFDRVDTKLENIDKKLDSAFNQAINNHNKMEAQMCKRFKNLEKLIKKSNKPN